MYPEPRVPAGAERRPWTRTILLSLILLAAAACGGEPAERPARLTILAHDSFDDGVTPTTFAAFTEETGIEVVVLAAGDAGAMVTQAVLTRENPLADVLFGVDDTFLSRALDGEIFLPYRASGVDRVDPSLLRTDDLVTPISYGDVCLNYDRDWYASSGVEPPASLDDLRDPDVASRLVVLHPATSSPGLAFLLATVDHYGEDGWQEFWANLRDGGVEVTSGWTEAYYGEFTRHGGDRPLVVSYASSPPAEVMFADPPTDTAPTGVMTSGCYRQVEYAGILDGTAYPEAAALLIDFMLSTVFQDQVPESWFVYPVSNEATLPPVFQEHTVLPSDPTRFDTALIASNRERWINEWVNLMERR
jgi:thiamine transport system substrate-binding protein